MLHFSTQVSKISSGNVFLPILAELIPVMYSALPLSLKELGFRMRLPEGCQND